MTWQQDVTSTTHGLRWTGQAGDPGWAAASGPGAPIDLDVIDVTTQADWDRVPSTRLTIRIHPPAAGVRWLSPLRRTCWVKLWAAYATPHNGEQVVGLGEFQLRRRRLTWPVDGTVTLDVASWDGHHAERWAMYEDIGEAEEG